MRKLSEIIKYDLSRQTKRRLKTFDEYLYEHKISEESITDKDIFNYNIQKVWPSDTNNDTYEDWINETLTPHSKDKSEKYRTELQERTDEYEKSTYNNTGTCTARTCNISGNDTAL